MSFIVISTRALVGLLADAALTAYPKPDEFPALAGLLLDTNRGNLTISSEDEEEGTLMSTFPSDLLVATSTDGVTMVAQCHEGCEGGWHRPVLLSTQDAQAVVKTFTAKAKSAPKGAVHQTLVSVDGETIRFEEDRAAVTRPTTMTVAALDDAAYPRGIEKALAPDPSAPVRGASKNGELGPLIPRSYGLGMNGVAFEVVSKIEKRRKMLPRWYSHHQLRGVVVEVGSMWRAVFMPAKPEDGQGDEPQVAVYAPRLLPKPSENADQPPLPAEEPSTV